MSINSMLKREGITVVRKLDTLEVNRIAKSISDKINKYFSDFIICSEDLFSALSRIDMYLAQMPKDSSCAKYLYINNSIYFNEEYEIDTFENSIFALHECLHFIQTCRNEHGKVFQLGLYKIGHSGMALNEAAVQSMASVAQGLSSSTEKYYDINIHTISPNCYPLQCALLSEMTYFTGTYPLYQSTINSNDIFKNTFISYADEATYKKIENNLDKILNIEDDLYYLSLELETSSSSKETKLIQKIIEKRKNTIKNIFFETQNTIIQTCFTKAYNSINSQEDINNFTNKLYNFKDVMCYTDDYNEFDEYNEFYCNAMAILDSVRSIVKIYGNMNSYLESNTSLVVQTKQPGMFSFIKRAFQKIRKIFSINRGEIQYNMQTNRP